jgi:hypothetical protein
MSTWTAPTSPRQPPEEPTRSRWKPATAAVGVALLTLGALTAAWALGRDGIGSSTATPTTSAEAGSFTTAPSSSASTDPAATSSASGVTKPIMPQSSSFRFQPLWPFGSVAEAVQWQHTGAQGHQPWRLDAARTALTFARDYLGYDEIDRVVSRRVSGDQAWIGVGATPVEGKGSAAAVLHLAQIGAGADRPWEVVGSRDSILSITTPRYGSRISSPLTVGGRITGVDESLHVRVLALGSRRALGEVQGISAGGQAQPWSVKVPYRSPASGVITVAVSTGGHLYDVEQFAITGLRRQPAR